MLRKISSHKFILLSVGIGIFSLAQSSIAQEHNHPALNSFGRFWGIGWSHGYHSATTDGRFQAVKNRHPASMYASTALTYPYDRGYEAAPNQFRPPLTPAQNWQNGYPRPMGSPVQNFGSQAPPINVPTPAPQIETPSPKPVEPPPTWLRPYLKNDAATEEKPVELVPAVEELSPPNLDSDLLSPDNSPSDLPKAKSDDDDLLVPQAGMTPMQRYYQARQKQALNR